MLLRNDDLHLCPQRRAALRLVDAERRIEPQQLERIDRIDAAGAVDVAPDEG
ncbi:MAG TPA: hypothetical protein VMR52_07630 [Dehalococcoidia bacterium]|nr:hypothetical protein [Dehalococcoidia bacterium]